MKIVQVVSSISEEASGPTYVVKSLCNSMRELGHEITLATLDWAQVHNPPPYLKVFPIAFGPKKLGHSPKMYRWLNKKAQLNDIDIIHSHGLWMMTNIYPSIVSSNHNISLLVSPHGCLTRYAMQSGSIIKPFFMSLIQRPALNSVTCFHALSLSEYHDIRELGFKQPIAIINNGVDTYESTKQYSYPRTLLYFGRIHPEKGIDILIKAWAIIENDFLDWRLLVVGPSINGYIEVLRGIVEQLNCDRVVFEEAKYGEDKLDCYRNAEVYVLASPSEGQPMTVLESLACGTPVIVSKGAPFSELLTHNAGWWIDIGVDPLVACLKYVLAQPPDVLKVMGERGRVWMERDFSWNKITRDFTEVYAWLNGQSTRLPSCIKID